MKSIKAVRGMRDITPDQSADWSCVERVIENVFSAYAFQEIRLPIVESTQLFSRSIGEVTDIVEKEMYSFADRNGESLSLRPEGTAGCVRACIENGLLTVPRKLWYAGPMFRYERPQKGRQRQFHQIGAEVFGCSGPEIEAEILLLTQRLWQSLGVDKNVELQLNTIGSSEDRVVYREALVGYLRQRADELDADSQRRLETNPMRILDSKSPATQSVLDEAPLLRDYLSDDSKRNEQRLLELLDASGVKYQANPRLVRGLDYYNDLVFEWVTEDLGAQGTVCAGGRYDGLVEQLGGKAVPAVGFAMGVERLHLLLQAAQSGIVKGEICPDCYLIVESSALQPVALSLAENLRDALGAICIKQDFSFGSLKSQFKRADKSGARFAIIVGAQEVESKAFGLKDLSQGEQQHLDVQGLISALRLGLCD